jgi:mutator protein MutT
MQLMTLSIIHDDEKILLGLKKRGFGNGLWNSFGGKINDDETPEQANDRELEEELGIKVLNKEYRGVLLFEFEDGRLLKVILYRVTEWSGNPEESEEILPKWFAINDIPYTKMWADDADWLPPFLDGKNIEARFVYKDESTIIHKEINIF